MITIIIDQFPGPSPYMLERTPITWSTFIADIKAGLYDAEFRPPMIIEHDDDDDIALPMASTAYRSTADGYVSMWRHRWDSSG